MDVGPTLYRWYTHVLCFLGWVKPVLLVVQCFGGYVPQHLINFINFAVENSLKYIFPFNTKVNFCKLNSKVFSLNVDSGCKKG